jgi:hypothetical protein
LPPENSPDHCEQLDRQTKNPPRNTIDLDIPA